MARGNPSFDSLFLKLFRVRCSTLFRKLYLPTGSRGDADPLPRQQNNEDATQTTGRKAFPPTIVIIYFSNIAYESHSIQ
jgi:hypothetical protein